MAPQSPGILKEKKSLHCWSGVFQKVLFQFGLVLEFHIRVPKIMYDT